MSQLDINELSPAERAALEATWAQLQQHLALTRIDWKEPCHADAAQLPLAD